MADIKKLLHYTIRLNFPLSIPLKRGNLGRSNWNLQHHKL